MFSFHDRLSRPNWGEGAFQISVYGESAIPFAPNELSIDTVKGFVDRLMRSQKKIQPGSHPPKRSQSQETIAHILGYDSWHTLHQDLVQRSNQQSNHEAAPVLSFPGRLACDADVSFRLEGQSWFTDFTWTKDSGNVLLFGPLAQRRRVLVELAKASAAPVLWVLSSRMGSTFKDVPGFGSYNLNSETTLHAIIHHAVETFPADRMTDFLMGLVDQGDGPGSQIWVARARSLLSPVVNALVYRRDHNKTRMTAALLRSSLILEGVKALQDDPDLPDYLRLELTKKKHGCFDPS